jgi:hypothetical protein
MTDLDFDFDFGKERIAGLIGAMLTESHGIETAHQGDQVTLPEHSLTVTVDEPVIHHDGAFLEVPISVGQPTWGYAWDRSVGVARENSHPIGEALMAWTHHVLPLFIAVNQPAHPLADGIYRQVMQDTSGAAVEILAGPVMTRKFSGLTEAFDHAIGENPPTLIVAEWLVDGGEIPAGRPIWLYTMCGRVGGSGIVEVTVNNTEVTEHFEGFADDVDWGAGSGTAKSWAVLHRLPE